MRPNQVIQRTKIRLDDLIQINTQSNYVLHHPFKYATKDHGSWIMSNWKKYAVNFEWYLVKILFTRCQVKILQVNCKRSYFQSNNSQSHTIFLLNKWALDWSLKMLSYRSEVCYDTDYFIAIFGSVSFPHVAQTIINHVHVWKAQIFHFRNGWLKEHSHSMASDSCKLEILFYT